jgi:hypothetical protein
VLPWRPIFRFPGPAVEPIAKAPAVPDWLVTIGAEVRAIPAWPGAPTDKLAFGGFPLVALQKPGDPPFFFGARDGFGIPILDFGQLQIGPVATINYPRYVWQYQQLNALGEVPWALQLGGYAQWWATPWLRLRGEVRQGIGGETGVTGNLYVDAVVPLGQWRLSAGPRLTRNRPPRCLRISASRRRSPQALGSRVSRHYRSTTRLAGSIRMAPAGRSNISLAGSGRPTRSWNMNASLARPQIRRLLPCEVRRTSSRVASAPSIPSPCTRCGERALASPALSSRHKRQPLEQVHILLVLDQCAMQRRD